MNDLVTCSKCGKMHPRGTKCPTYKPKRKYEGGEERRLRGLRAWRNKAEQIKQDANYLCEVCKDEGRLIYKGLEVHHIHKLRDHPEGYIEDENLICLCVRHHKMADRGELSVEYLEELARKRSPLGN